MIWFWVSFGVFIAGLAWVLLRYGVPASISESYYLLPSKWRMAGFYGWMCATGFPLMAFWLNATQGDAMQALPFLSCALLVVTGAAAPFRDGGLVHTVHMYCAAGAALCSQLWLAFQTPYWVFSPCIGFMFGIAGVSAKGKTGDGRARNCLVFFLELWAFMCIYAYLLFYHILL
jgi:hypothetical protein